MRCVRPPLEKPEPVVAVVPIGSVAPIAAKVVIANIRGQMNLKAEVTAGLDHPAYALDRKRLQYDVAPIMAVMKSLPLVRYDRVIGLLDVDLFVPIFTYVFGEAQQGGRYALVSMFRLDAGVERGRLMPPILLERTAKVALHEVGHLYGLSHCPDPHCLMHFSGDLIELDVQSFTFCRYCNADFAQRVRCTKRAAAHQGRRDAR